MIELIIGTLNLDDDGSTHDSKMAQGGDSVCKTITEIIFRTTKSRRRWLVWSAKITMLIAAVYDDDNDDVDDILFILV